MKTQTVQADTLQAGDWMAHPMTGETITVTEVSLETFNREPHHTRVSYSVTRGARTDRSFLTLHPEATALLVVR